MHKSGRCIPDTISESPNPIAAMGCDGLQEFLLNVKKSTKTPTKYSLKCKVNISKTKSYVKQKRIPHKKEVFPRKHHLERNFCLRTISRLDTDHSIMGFFWFSKARVSCQNPLGLSSRERGRYDLQTIIFWGMKHEGNIADMFRSSPR
jgi:hypothetical protein